MRCILNDSQDPYINLATEEYLLKNSDEEIFMLWRCYPSVIIGKHQNTLAEINYSWVKENRIRVARRITGGGTVYHDSGNINFTFIRNGRQGHLVNYPGQLEPVIEILNNLGINAIMGKKNEILLKGRKISGNAEHIYKSRILHHGTLLFDADLEMLKQAIKVTPRKYTDKAVKSIRSDVTNIRFHASRNLSTEKFMNRLFESFVFKNADNDIYSLSPSESSMISLLTFEKYNTWEWIYGYSPGYRFENTIDLDDRHIIIKLDVKNGRIISAILDGNFFTGRQAQTLTESLIHQKHAESSINTLVNTVLGKNAAPDYIQKITDAFF